MRRKDHDELILSELRQLRLDVDRTQSQMKLLSVEWDDMLVRLHKAYRRVERGNSRAANLEEAAHPAPQASLPLAGASDPFSKKLQQVRDQGAVYDGSDESTG